MSGNENTQIKIGYRYFLAEKIHKFTQERKFEAAKSF